jgi:hypothetical protein
MTNIYPIHMVLIENIFLIYPKLAYGYKWINVS